MMNNTDKSKENIFLTSNRTVFIIPFSFEDERSVLEALESPESIWGKAELSVVKNILYPQIQDYLQAETNSVTRRNMEGKVSEVQHYNIYSIKRSFRSVDTEIDTGREVLCHKLLCWEKFAGNLFCIQGQKISFKIDTDKSDTSDMSVGNESDSRKFKENLFSPHLILWQYAHVGILIFSTTLQGKDICVEDLMDFNYLFRKTDQTTIGCPFPLIVLDRSIKALEKGGTSVPVDNIREGISKSLAVLNGYCRIMGKHETNMKSVISVLYFPKIFELQDMKDSLVKKKEKLEKQKNDLAAGKEKTADKNSGIEKEINRITNKLTDCKKELDTLYEQVGKKFTKLGLPFIDDQEIRKIENWNSSSLVDFLFDVLNHHEAQKNGKKKLISLHNKLRIHLLTYYQMEEKHMDANPDLILQDVIRIARGENRKYEVRCVDAESSSILMRLFDNFLVSSSVEGCALLTLKPKVDSDYFNTFETGVFAQKYLWIYFWILLQRHSQFYCIQRLTRQDNFRNPDKLRDLVYFVQQIKACSYFTDISDYTHHNQFYQFCKKNLYIEEHFKEIEEKLVPLYSFIHSEEIEEKERWGNIFGLIVALFTIISVVNDGTQYFTIYIYDGNQIKWPGIMIFLIVTVIILSVWFKFYKYKKKL